MGYISLIHYKDLQHYVTDRQYFEIEGGLNPFRDIKNTIIIKCGSFLIRFLNSAEYSI